MKQKRIKRILSLLCIGSSAIALIIEISSENKNYYIQSIGVVLLMIGLFYLNSKIEPKTEVHTDTHVEEE